MDSIHQAESGDTKLFTSEEFEKLDDLNWILNLISVITRSIKD